MFTLSIQQKYFTLKVAGPFLTPELLLVPSLPPVSISASPACVETIFTIIYCRQLSVSNPFTVEIPLSYLNPKQNIVTLKDLFIPCVYVYVSYMWVHSTYAMPEKARVRDSCKSPTNYWESNLSLLQEPCVLLTDLSSSRPHKTTFICHLSLRKVFQEIFIKINVSLCIIIL